MCLLPSTTTGPSLIACIKVSFIPKLRFPPGYNGWCAATSVPPGVIFTLDTESGFDKVVFITASYGLGETVVKGAVNPDEFYVYKPALTQGRPAILRRNLGSKLIKMQFAEGQGALIRSKRWMWKRGIANGFPLPMQRWKSWRVTHS